MRREKNTDVNRTDRERFNLAFDVGIKWRENVAWTNCEQRNSPKNEFTKFLFLFQISKCTLIEKLYFLVDIMGNYMKTYRI